MKVAVKIPDDLVEKSDQLARALQKSRSELYADALAEHLALRGADAIRKKLDAVYAVTPAKIDPSLARAQSAALGEDAW